MPVSRARQWWGLLMLVSLYRKRAGQRKQSGRGSGCLYLAVTGFGEPLMYEGGRGGREEGMMMPGFDEAQRLLLRGLRERVSDTHYEIGTT